MDKHPIENIMSTTLENIRDMIDVNTVVGEPIAAADGSTVIPISRVSFGFVAGGGEYGKAAVRPEEGRGEHPFAGGTGAGVTVQPLGFLVTSAETTRMLPAQCFQPLDRAVEMLPQVIADIRKAIGK